MVKIKVCGPDLVTYLNQTPVFDWCVVRYGSKNRRHVFQGTVVVLCV